MINYAIITGPTAEPVTLTEAKRWLQLDEIGGDDSLIAGLVAAARQNVEAETGLFLMTQTIEQYFDWWPDYRFIDLAFGPVQSVTSLSYLDAEGDSQTFDSANYTTDLTSRPARIVLNPSANWPSLGFYPNSINIRYVVGYASAATVPDTLKTAINLQCRMLYDNREDMAIKDNDTPVLRAAGWLKNQHRAPSI